MLGRPLPRGVRAEILVGAKVHGMHTALILDSFMLSSVFLAAVAAVAKKPVAVEKRMP